MNIDGDSLYLAYGTGTIDNVSRISA
ncbi:hypothetical protein CRENPOLYSF1_350029 [Crenothrix polyspora]|uniref:Uncharacterized protein n=1 Tax=Crenothrix polyspora TaxID=360316 RepID=A0A1R4HAN3_9GAMM|nr:hypothetical protein CRENPOLYSF1_350029 [Crenothrix polyspora]